MIEVPFNWNLLPRQMDFVMSKGEDILYHGGFGSGKTVAGSIRTYLLANHIPGNRILVARKTYRELFDTTYRTFMEWLPKEMFGGERKSDDIVYIRSRDGRMSEVFFRSLDRPEKFKSMELGAAWFDEASESSEDEFRIVKGRLRLTAAKYRCLYLTTNPTTKDHWLYRHFVANPMPGRERFHAPTYENRANLPAGYIEELERTYPKDWIEVYLRGEFGFTLVGLPVFNNFVQTLHVAAEPLKWDGHSILYRGWDFGVVRPALVVYGQDSGGRWRGYKEILGYNMGTRRFAEYVLPTLNAEFPGAKWRDFCDPAGFDRNQVDERTAVEELNNHGVYPVKIPRTTPKQRAEVINHLLMGISEGQPNLQIDPSMEITLQALRGGYARKKPEQGKPVDDEPVKDGYFEHIIDAMGFILFGTVGRTQERSHTYEEARSKARQRGAALYR